MKKELELYIHIPFCVKKCKYCDFLSAPCDVELRGKYVESLCRKIRSYQELAKAYHVVSIFIGGGTPSLLTEKDITEICDAVRNGFRLEPDIEWTIESWNGNRRKIKDLF